jgi:hypothetical protein
MGRDFERSGRGLFEIIPFFLEGVKKMTESFGQENRD